MNPHDHHLMFWLSRTTERERSQQAHQRWLLAAAARRQARLRGSLLTRLRSRLLSADDPAPAPDRGQGTVPRGLRGY